MLTCQEFTDQISDHLEGDLPLAKRLGFMMHLAICKNCRLYRDQIANVAAMLGSLRAEAPDDDARKTLLEAMRDAVQRPSDEAPLPPIWDPEQERTGT